ncbi:alpha/beta-tubulin-N-acetyltransferase 9-like isoform X5 [Schistocerca gregaria]|uniref:alpha/beta-tubulin-N-acetyltransferase 9-like isoform X5 n=1 Tax=Schistocerca gregaria TaxID=7010 RepID=UPI00211EDA71|nr:alpha/beta-tubulin-N-acetyltransferase 9-like isoform X5 [Schistocerca gregaria]
MKINANTKIIGKNVILVPYRAEHVPKYHEWMQSEELQHLTASEPLTLEEEYSMQQSWLHDANSSMVGDTNLFLQEPEDSQSAEIEIMIAEEKARGKKYGWEATLLMLCYGCEVLGIKKFQAKIGLDNVKSISMFSKMGFNKVSESNIFQEVTMERIVDNGWKSWLLEQTQGSEQVKD